MQIPELKELAQGAQKGGAERVAMFLRPKRHPVQRAQGGPPPGILEMERRRVYQPTWMVPHRFPAFPAPGMIFYETPIPTTSNVPFISGTTTSTTT